MFDLRQSPSIDKDGNPDNDGIGYSWFPGYAIDVETGKRLNIFFGENSIYNEALSNDPNVAGAIPPNGEDMMFNPTSQLFFGQLNPQTSSAVQVVMGGHHYIYVTRQEYDGCADLHDRLENPTLNTFDKIDALPAITWASMVLLPEGVEMLHYNEGAILNDVTVKLRVDNPYNLETFYNILNPRTCNIVDGELPKYQFELRNKEVVDLTPEEYAGALENVNVVPNPYYAYSSYEINQFNNTVKITNLPDEATVTIYSLDGKFIKQFRRDEQTFDNDGANPGVLTGQTDPDIEWDLQNSAGIPIASGVYLIHISAPSLGEERTIKWFGVNRKFDPSGL